MLQRILSIILIISFVLPNFAFPQTRRHDPTRQDEPLLEAPQQADGAEDSEESDPLERAQRLELVLSGKVIARHPLDSFGLLIQEVHSPRGFSAREIRRNGLLIANVQAREGFDLTYRGEILHRFSGRFSSVTRLGDFIVFIEDGSFISETHVQNVSFIDLKYFELALGRTALPIFRVPVALDSATSEVRTVGDTLMVGDTALTSKVFEFFSEPQQIAFNTTVNLLDAQAADSATPVIDSFEEYFEKAVELQSDDIVAQLDRVAGSRESLLKFANEVKTDVTSARTRLVDSASAGVLRSMSDNMATQRKLLNRLMWLGSRLSFPQPLGAPKIQEALAFVGAGAVRLNTREGRANFKESILQLANHSVVKWGATIGLAAIAGASYPEQTVRFVHQALHISSTVLTTVLGTAVDKTYDFASLGWEAAKATFSGFNPVTFKKAYLTAERLPKLGVGISAMVGMLYTTLGLPHLIVNSVKLAKDLRGIDLRRYREENGGWLAGLKRAFIERQNQEQRDYLRNLSEAEAAALGLDAAKAFTAEDDAAVDAKIGELRAKDQATAWHRFIKKISDRPFFKRLASKSDGELATFGQAMRHFLFSFCSFTNSGYAYTKIWNGWFFLRSFIFTPVTWFTLMAYPNYFSTLTSQYGKATMPTEWNGGVRSLWEKASLMIGSRQYLRELETFEAKLIPAEQLIQAAVLKRTFHELIHFTDSNTELREVFLNGGVKDINDPVLDKLTRQQRMFFRLYFTNLFNQSMEHYLGEAVRKAGVDAPVEVDQLKDAALSLNVPIELTEIDAARIVETVDANSMVFETAKKSAETFSLDQAGLALKYRFLKKLDPKNNRQVSRMMAVRKQMNNPKAMARAVRSMIASNIVDKPMELALVFVCLAGIENGLMQPIQDQMFSENSWFYLSRYVFLNGYVYGVLSGVLADTWSKLQQDELHEGSFGEVPQGKDADGSYLKWFWKKTFRNPHNTLWQNQRHNLRIIWANMKAALATMLVVNLATMGRFDLDSYAIGYLFTFTLPLVGFASKLEQGFELASGFDAKDIPENLRPHPKAQEYLAGKIGKRRIWFNLWYKIYENISADLFGNYEQMRSKVFGSRAFSRILLGGFTPTELAVKTLRASGKTLAFLPGAEYAATWCESLLTHNYTDWSKVAPKK